MATATQERNLDAYLTTTGQVSNALGVYAAALWASMDAYRDADVDRMVDAVVPRVTSGQLAMASLTAAYVANTAGVTPSPVSPAVTQGRGVDALEVYRRPAVTTYTALSEGKDFRKAVLLGGLRLGALVAMDLQMAKVRQARQSMEDAGYKYYRRVLSGNENCALCMIASTQRYSTGELLPIHPGCDCGVAPVTDGGSVPQILDEDLLEATHSRVGDFTGTDDRGGRAPDYRKLITVHEHGEHGPSLRWADDTFTGPGDI